VKQIQPDSSLDALTEVGRILQRCNYRFTAVTPETCRRNNKRFKSRSAMDAEDPLRAALGWNRPFARTALPANVLSLLDSAGVLRSVDGGLISTVRYSTLGANLFVHSGYPTLEDDSVFFGPDSYRFSAFIVRELAGEPPPRGCRILDVGCGSGVGGIVAGQMCADANVVLADINVRALQYAMVNARLADFERKEFRESDILSGVHGMFDVIIANPPYMVDARARIYRDGGAYHGAAVSLRILRESLQSFKQGARLLMYTGAAIVSGRDIFLEQAKEILVGAGLRFRYEEIDPDVFGEELDEPAYADVERIAAVGLVVYANDYGGKGLR
jgi:release factor glutamine methyltransferase